MSYFEELADGTLVGYHIEGGETLDGSGLPPLSMETLTDSRTLYMCNNPIEWFADHLLGKINQRVLKVTFRKVTSQEYPWEHYMSMRPRTANLLDGEEATSFDPCGCETYIRTGIYLHYTLGEPKGELTEGFLIQPKQHVISIEEIPAQLRETLDGTGK